MALVWLRHERGLASWLWNSTTSSRLSHCVWLALLSADQRPLKQPACRARSARNLAGNTRGARSRELLATAARTLCRQLASARVTDPGALCCREGAAARWLTSAASAYCVHGELTRLRAQHHLRRAPYDSCLRRDAPARPPSPQSFTRAFPGGPGELFPRRHLLAATTSGPRGRPRVERQTCITRRALPQLAIAPHVPKPAYSAERCSPRRSCCYINDLRHSANHCRAARLPPGQRGGNQASSAAEFGVGQTRG